MPGECDKGYLGLLSRGTHFLRTDVQTLSTINTTSESVLGNKPDALDKALIYIRRTGPPCPRDQIK